MSILGFAGQEAKLRIIRTYRTRGNKLTHFIDEIQNLVIGYNFCRGSTNKIRFGGMDNICRVKVPFIKLITNVHLLMQIL